MLGHSLSPVSHPSSGGPVSQRVPRCRETAIDATELYR
ncbi:hypothetical protein BURMUCF1_A1922 [Burkholderia multivorans ATCC BAA-247]|uniref:Uncharacterized protein n=1 Tax=Burkholderia multivorans CGD2 TaxID=513052 RepID=B9BLL2_9BURK|nr:hypothetical protein BURMUCGD2_5970 [Burkholderia multivorans CGD2]EEE16515.1 hypothetical protein BURMUCGD2M_5960 [Burkholderia multivorans CGD2M]EJO62166.1 hypothetical protein BURMUCF1_A1922 [Burkholderia multivorans ATCC BAA-247]